MYVAVTKSDKIDFQERVGKDFFCTSSNRLLIRSPVLYFLLLFFLCPAQFFPSLFPLTSSNSTQLLFTDGMYFSHQCLCTSVSLLSFFLIPLLLGLLLFTRCSILCSYFSFSAFLLSPLLSCHLCVAEVRCLKGRFHAPFECN